MYAPPSSACLGVGSSHSILYFSQNVKKIPLTFVSGIFMYSLFIFQIFVDRCSRLFPCAHRKDNRCRTCYCVTAGIHAFSCCLVCFLIYHQTAFSICFQTFCCASDQGVRGCTDGHNYCIYIDHIVRAFHRHRASSATGIGFTQLHFQTFDTAYLTISVINDLYRISQQMEFDAFFLCMVYFFQ